MPTIVTMPSAEWQDDLLTSGVIARRVVAFLVDGLFVTIIVLGLAMVLFLFGLITLGLGLPLLGVLPVVPFGYGVFFLASTAATPGQAMLGLTVRRNRDLAPPDLFEALVFMIGFSITLALGAFWLAIALVTIRRRAPHDLLSGLVVVRRRALPAAADARWNAG